MKLFKFKKSNQKEFVTKDEVVYDENKIYNLDKQFIANVLFLKMPKDSNKEQIEKLIDLSTSEVMNFLSKYLNRELSNKTENEKIKNYISNYLSDFTIEKQTQEVGLLEIKLDDIIQLENQNQKGVQKESQTNASQSNFQNQSQKN